MTVLIRYISIYFLVLIAFLMASLAFGIFPPPGFSMSCALASFMFLLKKLSKAEKSQLLSRSQKHTLFSTILIIELIVIPLQSFIMFNNLVAAISSGLIALIIVGCAAWYAVYRYADGAIIENKI